MRTALRVIAISSGLAVLLTGAFAQTPPGYFGIPAGFDYPADKQKLEEFRKKGDMPALRRHSWMLFAGMTQLTPDNTPYWETWFRESETFRVGPGPQGPRRIIREFSTPRQMKRNALSPHAPGNSAMTTVLFNWESSKHIRDNRLHLRAKLKQINDGFP